MTPQTVEPGIVLISGDSWSAGTWDIKGEVPISNEGIGHEFITAGYHVRNLSKPGGSNLESVVRLGDYLKCNQHELSSVRFILFWQTEFFREIWYYHPKDNTYIPLEDELAHGYTKIKNHWIYRPYHRLTELSQRWQLPIYVIGGCSDSVWYDNFENDFPGVKIVCQSVTNLLLNCNHRIEDPVFCEFLPRWIDRCDFLAQMKSNISIDDLENLMADIDLGHHRVSLFKKNSPKFFGPDKIHPNGAAHHAIFKHLMQNIPELQVDHKSNLSHNVGYSVKKEPQHDAS